MPYLLQRYIAQRELVEGLANVSRQSKGDVQLLAVSKTRPASEVMALYIAGQRNFGENYLQEAMQKQRVLAHLDIAWHFIGPIQSNKTRDIARYFNWVHSVDRLKVAQRLDQQRPLGLPPLNICLQVNVDDEASKSGFKLAELADMIQPMVGFKNIKLRGLMAIPKADKTIAEQRSSFKKVAQVKDKLNEQFGLGLDTLSMGMSGDLEPAIAEGATMVRIGTAIFGARVNKTA